MPRGLAFAALLLLGLGPLAAGEPLRQPLVYEIVFSDAGGSESFRARIADRFAVEMERSGCFADVRPRDDREPAAGELLYQVVLGVLDDETNYDYSIADKFDASTPPVDARRGGARQELDIGMNLFDRASDTLVRFGRRRIVTSHQTIIREDAREVSREEMVREVARRARVFVCKLSQAKLDKQIRKATGG